MKPHAHIHIWRGKDDQWNVTTRHANGRLSNHSGGYNRKSTAVKVAVGNLLALKLPGRWQAHLVYEKPAPEKRRKVTKVKKKAGKKKRPC